MQTRPLQFPAPRTQANQQPVARAEVPAVEIRFSIVLVTIFDTGNGRRYERNQHQRETVRSSQARLASAVPA